MISIAHRSALAAVTALALVILAVLLVLTPGSEQHGGIRKSAVAMPSCPATVLTKTGNQTAFIHQNNPNGTWDLRGAVWPASVMGQDTHPDPMRSDSWGTGCILGSEAHGAIGRTETREQWFNGTGMARKGGEIWRGTVGTNGFVVQRDGVGSDIEDANNFNAVTSGNGSVSYIDHQRLEWIRDDCVETEDASGVGQPMSVKINNVLWDGCFTVFAERPTYSNSGTKNGTGPQTLEVQDSLIYSNPQPLGSTFCSSGDEASHRCKANGSTWLGNHGIWKWSAVAASHVTMSNVTFRLDRPSYSSCSPQVWPDGTYTNVRLLWTDTIPYASAGGCTNTVPAGVTVVNASGSNPQLAIDEWNAKKAAWIAGGGTPTPTPSPTPTQTPTPTVTPTPTQTPTPTGTVTPIPTVTPTTPTPTPTTPPPSGVSYVGSSEAQANAASVTLAFPAGTQSGDTVVFQVVENKGTRSTVNTPSGLTAVGAEADDGGSLGSKVFKCVVGAGCPASQVVFTTAGETVYQLSATAEAYRGVSAVNSVATAIEGSTDTAHPVTGTTANEGWNLVMGADRAIGPTGTVPSNWTFGATLSERRTGGQCVTDQTAGCISQSVADTAALKPAASHTYTAGTSNSVQYAITRLVEIH